MTDRPAPESRAPEPRGPEFPLDDDPTGIRALLSTLPDPGPMPEHVVARIHASLAALAAEQDAPPVPVVPNPMARPGELPFVPSAPVHDLDAHRRRRGARWLPWAAAAGLVGVAGGGWMLGHGGEALTAAFHGGATAGSAAGARAGSLADASVDAQGQPSVTLPTEATPSGATPSGAMSSTVVVMTNDGWTQPDLAAAATRLVAGTSAPLTPLASESPSIGPIGTPLGARDCAEALGVAADARVVVDLGTYAGRPAALVVATTAAGEHTAYVVGRQCRSGSPDLVTGPIAF